MVSVEDFGEFETAWCPGCGNFSILKSLKQALAGLDLEPHKVIHVSGIGQAAKTPHYLRVNVFNGLHGRALPAAQGARFANPGITVIAESGDGCNYGEGGNHFISAIRRNVNVTLLAHDNQIYGLTKGQASPMTTQGHKTKAQPQGSLSKAFNPIAVAVALGAGFVARGFSGKGDHLADLIQQAVRFEGFALVDIMQPCVSFNKVNTFAWYKEHCYELPDDYDPTDAAAAMQKAWEFPDKIALGVLYRNDERTSYESKVPALSEGTPLFDQSVDKDALESIMDTFA
jgi:2-oxoglutarate ferredoxin oxidoreductase subunit beta